MSAKKKLILDFIMFGAFLVASNPHLTGITVHEWLSLSLAGAAITHLLFNWEWIVNVGKSFFRKFWHQSRLNFVVLELKRANNMSGRGGRSRGASPPHFTISSSSN